MNTKVTKNSRKRFLSLAAAGLLATVMGSNTMAAQVSASGYLDPKGAICVKANATYSLRASGNANAYIRFVIRPSSDPETNIVQKDNVTQFDVTLDNYSYPPFPGPGRYEACARNTTSYGVQLYNLMLTTY